ncbi:MAG: 2-phosphosulfolactate phosphatase [Verrucomicrobia bacterium]|nr:2-phosphosulfolactate phosphatase [Verrucomicrobiota bacterium]
MACNPKLEVLLTPADFAALRHRDLRASVCVVFDVLRATTSMITALARGAEAILPVAEIPDALALRRQRPDLLLAGERNGIRIGAELAEGIEFDLGNSPREFTAGRVRGRTVAMSTTNGTRALRACAGARAVLVSAFVNRQATVGWLQRHAPASLILVCAGTLDEAALEDTLAAGAVADALWPRFAGSHITDAAQIARQLWHARRTDLEAAMRDARNGRRLLANPDLSADVAFCLRHDAMPLVAGMDHAGAVRRWVVDDLRPGVEERATAG